MENLRERYGRIRCNMVQKREVFGAASDKRLKFLELKYSNAKGTNSNVIPFCILVNTLAMGSF